MYACDYQYMKQYEPEAYVRQKHYACVCLEKVILSA